jgi:outer membrane receptor protein involved in Fe transport
VVGATYKLAPKLTLYGGYSEANRAPTPAELACANPNLPCLMENFLASDPPLKQVVSHTWELGLRGSRGSVHSGKLDWSAGLFRTLNTDDIISELADASAIRGTFRNAGDTLRQGVEASASYTTRRMQLYGTYAFIDATFQSNLSLNSPSNPGNTAGDEVYEINVRPGDHMPGIPAHRIKAGASYMLTDAWKIGANVVYSSSQYYVGDENNQNAKLPGYAVVNLQTSYDINKHVQIYGMVNNVFDNKYAYYGTYFETGSVGDRFGEHVDARSVTPAAPLAAYGGLKVKF